MGLSSQDAVLLAGSTGLVGGLVLRLLLDSPGFSATVFAPVRRQITVNDPRLRAISCDFSSAFEGELLAAMAAPPRRLRAYISCLGTTIKAAGSRPEFIAVDRELVLQLAQLAYDKGARHALLVSSAAASRQSGNFYLRVKGEVEDGLEKIGFSRLDILQPGLLIGSREQPRPAEALAQTVAPLLNPLLRGKLRRYRSIEARDVAAAIVRLCGVKATGTFTHEHDEIRGLARSMP